MRNELRSIFQLYGKPGQWERLQAEIANERAEIKKQLEEEAKKKDLILAIAISVVLVTIAIVGGYYYITWLQGLNT